MTDRLSLLALHLRRAILPLMLWSLQLGSAGWALEPTNASEDWSRVIKPFLNAHCADCHSGGSAEAGIDFDKYESDEMLSSERARWNQILGMIKIGAMPPADYDARPSKELSQQVAQWIHKRVNTVDCDQSHDPGRVIMRRLNNVEYDNSVRDLLAIDAAPSALVGFPSDEVGGGFDNQGDVLSLSQMLLEKYMQAAAQIASLALDRPESLDNRFTLIPPLYLGDRQTVQVQLAQGDYEVKPRLQFMAAADDQSARVVVLVDGEAVETFEVTKRRRSFRTNLEFSEGPHEISLLFESDSSAEKKEEARQVQVESISVKGPPTVSESYKLLVRTVPSDSRSASDAARENLLPVLRRAYRREPTAEDEQRIIDLVRMALDGEMTFERALGVGLQAILVSPHFLFRVEHEEPSEVLNSYSLASRLSYFLWSSIPDDQLLELASQGKLSEPAVLAEQAERMLADPRSEALIKRFFGQYLGLGNLRDLSPDPKRFPMWNDRLREAMVRETELFCREIMTQDLPLEALLHADFTFVNPRLAELYGIDYQGADPAELFEQGPGYNVRSRQSRDGEYLHENRWIKVPVPAQRRGVLTHAAILTLTSNPTATSPVKRGKWIMETVLGDPPPPAPPNVPSFEVTQKEHEKLTLRQQLAIHRANPSCASCHDVMDPLGLGFEHFDAIGRWREVDSDLPVDASGQLADGRTFNGSTELVGLLAGEHPKIYRFFAEKLLTYALGRGFEPYDNCAVDSIVSAAQRGNYTMKSFVKAVAASEPFTRRRLDPTQAVSNR